MTDAPCGRVTTHDEVGKLRRRLAAAEAERDACHVRGPDEGYAQAYVRVKALELRLEEVLRQPLR